MEPPNYLDTILSNFKLPKRVLTLDQPEPITKPIPEEVEDVINYDYLKYTDNIKLEKPDYNAIKNSTASDVLFNHDYRLDPSKNESDYDKLVKSYQELYKLYQDTKETLYTTQQYLMRLSIISKKKGISDNGVYADRLRDIIQKETTLTDQQKLILLRTIWKTEPSD